MGGCATKPKVLTGDHERGVPAPVPVKEDAVTSAKVPAEAKVVVVDDKKVVGDGHGGITEITKVEEIVEDGKADDQNTKPRSLSNLFKVITQIIFFFIFYVFMILKIKFFYTLFQFS